ncbi:MAG: GIY-YIG nuclease family protein [Pseudomonas proteolytica]|uniref:GIY-YIG nuclease family protein n=1 Tax=Pseudomonas proteolytica TaxID=219574 RepID=UPI003F36B1A4
MYQVPQQLTPIICNCIYLIYCAKCSKQYVGQTKNALRIRIYQHTHNIKNKIEKRRHVVQHFLTHGLEAFRVTGLQSNPFWSLCDRLKFERLWIMRLDTKFPRGLNET